MIWTTILVLALITALIVSLGFTVYVKLFEKKYTRERFAFASLTASTSLVLYAMAQVTSHQPLQERIFVTIANLAGYPLPEPEPITSSGKALVILLAAFGMFIIHLLNRSINQWHGQVSVDDYARVQEHRSRPWIQDGIDEGTRVLKGAPQRKTRALTKQLALQAVLETPTPNFVWHEHARELVTLWASTIRFSTQHDGGWNSVAKCWKGRDTSRGSIVFLFCYSSQIGDAEQKNIADFLARFPSRSDFRILIATRTGNDKSTISINGNEAEILSERFLLDNLVDFTDYIFEVTRRVEEMKLPDSDLHIPDIYVESELTGEADAPPVGFEKLLFDWVVEPVGSHLAILGEYGQGKSTGALMFVYHYLQQGYNFKTGRIPILLELRGKSPANLSPVELLSAWAQQYQIHALALMKLLIAGRLVLVFEGFDEMANISDVEQRIDHFRKLWLFAYPNAKLAFTGRPNLFFQRKEIDVVFRGNAAGNESPCKVFHLKPFSSSQISESLRWLDVEKRDDILRVATSNSQLFDIVSRPSLLYIVGLLWTQLRDLLAGTITSADVIGRFVEHSFKRQRDKEALGSPPFMALTEGERRYFHEGIAYEMATMRAPNQITDTEFVGCIRRLYETYPKEGHLIQPGVDEKKLAPLETRLHGFDNDAAIDIIATDVRTHGILVNDLSRPSTYKFAHKSFFEYLAAKVAASQLLGQDRQFYGAIRAANEKQADLSQSREMLAFFGEIIVARFKRSPDSNSTSIEAMVFDRMIGLDALPRIVKAPTRFLIIFAYKIDTIFDGILFLWVEFVRYSLEKIIHIRGKSTSVPSTDATQPAPDTTNNVGNTEFVRLSNNTAARGMGSLMIAIGCLFSSLCALIAFCLVESPGLIQSKALIGSTTITICVAATSKYVGRYLERWALCLRYGGRTEEHLAALIGKRCLRRVLRKLDETI